MICCAVPIQDSLDMWRVGGDRESEPAGDLLLHVGDSKLQQVPGVLPLIHLETFRVIWCHLVVLMCVDDFRRVSGPFEILATKDLTCLFRDLLQRQRMSF